MMIMMMVVLIGSATYGAARTLFYQSDRKRVEALLSGPNTAISIRLVHCRRGRRQAASGGVAAVVEVWIMSGDHVILVVVIVWSWSL